MWKAFQFSFHFVAGIKSFNSYLGYGSGNGVEISFVNTFRINFHMVLVDLDFDPFSY